MNYRTQAGVYVLRINLEAPLLSIEIINENTKLYLSVNSKFGTATLYVIANNLFNKIYHIDSLKKECWVRLERIR